MRIKEVLNNRRRNKRRNEQRKSVAKRERARKIREAKLYFKAAKITALIIYGGSFGLEMGYEFGFHEYEMHPFTGINNGLVLFKNGLVWSFYTGWDGISWVYETIDNLDRPTYASSNDYDWGDDTYSSEPSSPERNNQSQESYSDPNNTDVLQSPELEYAHIFNRIYPKGIFYEKSQDEHGAGYDEPHNATDYVAGKGISLVSPFDGEIEDIYRDAWDNPTVVIVDSTNTLRYMVLHLDILEGLEIGDPILYGDVIGFESDNGYVKCPGYSYENSRISIDGGFDCGGNHAHVNLWRTDAAGGGLLNVSDYADRFLEGKEPVLNNNLEPVAPTPTLMPTPIVTPVPVSTPVPPVIISTPTSTPVLQPTLIPSPTPIPVPIVVETPVSVSQEIEYAPLENTDYVRFMVNRIYPEGTIYFESKGTHQNTLAIDYSTGERGPIIAPFSGRVLEITEAEDEPGSNSIITIIDDSDRLVLSILHMDSFSVVQGERFIEGTELGTEGNVGYTKCNNLSFEESEALRASGDEDCGIHIHVFMYLVEHLNSSGQIVAKRYLDPQVYFNKYATEE